MGVSADILSAGQQYDLSTGSISNQLILRLPDGSMLTASVDDEGLQRIVSFRVNGHTAKEPVPTPEAVQSNASFGTKDAAIFAPTGAEVDTFTTFGGDYQPHQTSVEETPLAPSRPPEGRRVMADEHGYPIMPHGTDHSSVLADGPNVDEDGVTSL